MEGRPIETKPARQVRQARSSSFAKYKGLIIAVAAIVVVAGCAFLYISQERAKKYDAAFKKGTALWTQRDAENALVQFRKAAEIDRTDPELWVLIGKCEGALAHPDRASAAWEEALRQRPGYRPALFERGKEALGLHVTRRIPPPVAGTGGWLSLALQPAAGDEVQKIQADLNEAALENQDFSRFAKGAGRLFEGRYREAAPLLQAYADQNLWDTTAIAIAGVAFYFGGSPNRAEKALTEALTRRDEKAWVKVRADAKYLQADYGGARDGYREAGLEKEAQPLFEHRIPPHGVVLWLRADAGVDLTDTSVSKWKDQSGAGHDAAPKEPALGPKLSAAAFHGRPAIQFAGKEDDLFLPDGFEDFSAGLSVWVVGEASTEPIEEWSFILLATPARGAARIETLIGKRRSSEQLIYAVEDPLDKQRRLFVEGIPFAKEFEVVSAIHEPGGAARLYKRGAPAGEAKLLIPRKVLRTRNRIGSGLPGRVAEIVLYDRSLSELERLGVEAYFKDRYFADGAAAEKR